ncbi:MAG TPA: PRC-barrel domain-containing protein [Burkholderiales bacterium]|nr:PRC-barrel domain-containing protein [Burkholderiales bacterium]
MLRSVKRLRGQPIVARDGAIGFIVDVYFDDRSWRVRYLVLDTGRPMPRRRVLIAPACVQPAGEKRAQDERIHVRLTRAEIEKCPELDEDRPVFLQHDMGSVTARGDPHLRSAEVVMGFAVHGPPGRAGHLKDILVDSREWTVQSLVVDTGVWLPGRRALVAPGEVEGLDWIERAIDLQTRSFT